MNKHSQKGFTLIELLVVIAIIGILSSVVLASLNTARQKGREVAFKAEMDSFKKAAELFYDDYGMYTGLHDNSAPIATTTADVSAQGILASLELKTSDGSIHGLVSDNAYALYGRMPGSAVDSNAVEDIWCIDSTGKSGNPNSVASGEFTTPVDACW